MESDKAGGNGMERMQGKRRKEGSRLRKGKEKRVPCKEMGREEIKRKEREREKERGRQEVRWTRDAWE